MAELLIDLVVYVLLPAFVTAVVVQTIQLALFSASRLSSGNDTRPTYEWISNVAVSGSVAAIAGVFVGNAVRGTFPWWPNAYVWSGLLYWLLGVMVVELVVAVCGTVRIPRGMSVGLRVLIIVAASAGLAAALTPEDLRATLWPRVLLASVIAAGWIGGHWLGTKSDNRWSTAIILAGSCLGLAGVLIHASMARFMEAAMSVTAATTGGFLAFVIHKWWNRPVQKNVADAGESQQSNTQQSNADGSNLWAGLAVGPVAAFVPIMALVGHNESYSNVPWYSFALVGLTPFTMFVSQLVSLLFLRTWKPFWVAVIAVILAAAVSATGLGIAAWFEPLSAH